MFNLSLPNPSFALKVAITLVIIVFVVKMLPASWNIKQWFTV